jgi:ComF family protein
MCSRRRRATSILSSGSGATRNASRFPTRLLRSTLDGLVAVFLAPSCAACGDALDQPTAGAVCARCWAAIVPLTPLGSSSLPPHVLRATAIGSYDVALKAIVHALKYDRRPTIARGLARQMRTAGASLLEDADAVVPVPLHRSRERARGFNQAREIARHLGVPLLNALTRVRSTAAQADLPAAKRDANVRGAFALAPGVVVKALTLVLIDDVTTTGSTLNACAAPLLAAGAKDVRALTAARAPRRSDAPPR